MELGILIALIAIVILLVRYKVNNILKKRNIDKLNSYIKHCEIAIFKIKNVDTNDFQKLVSIQKDLYAKGVRPTGLSNRKYFLTEGNDLTLNNILIYSIDPWHLDSLDFWDKCDQVVGDNTKGVKPDTLHKTLVFHRYKNILTGSIGDHLNKLKTKRIQCLQSK